MIIHFSKSVFEVQVMNFKEGDLIYQVRHNWLGRFKRFDHASQIVGEYVYSNKFPKGHPLLWGSHNGVRLATPEDIVKALAERLRT